MELEIRTDILSPTHWENPEKTAFKKGLNIAAKKLKKNAGYIEVEKDYVNTARTYLKQTFRRAKFILKKSYQEDGSVMIFRKK